MIHRADGTEVHHDPLHLCEHGCSSLFGLKPSRGTGSDFGIHSPAANFGASRRSARRLPIRPEALLRDGFRLRHSFACGEFRCLINAWKKGRPALNRPAQARRFEISQRWSSDRQTPGCCGKLPRCSCRSRWWGSGTAGPRSSDPGTSRPSRRLRPGAAPRGCRRG